MDTNVFTVIAHPVRREILSALAHGDVTVTELAKPFEISRSAISQHLNVLLDSGLVAVEKRGREHYYRLRPENLNEVYRWIKQFEHFWNEKLDALEAYLDEEYPPDESQAEL
ncbi:MAG: metalloregulator ArsR/SmtB family transcription factor [Anaerolineae bacterium]|nr:metalloregulator ArsR/SmtB family transcription factor [Anaerolineae bacterium]